MIERFCQELDCTFSHCLDPHSGVSMGSNEDDRNVGFLFLQLGLQLQTRHLRHADIKDQARGLTMQIGFEEFFRRSEAPCDSSPAASMRSRSESCIASSSSIIAIIWDVRSTDMP